MKIAAGGSAADPPHIGHVILLTALIQSNQFSRVIWIPSGSRKDKQYSVSPDDRVAMTELTIRELRLQNKTELVVRYTDVYYENTPTILCIEILKNEFPETEIVWYTGSDSVAPHPEGKTEIEKYWYKGEQLMKENFLIFPREGYRISPNIPPNFEIFDFKLPNISSSEIRGLIQKEEPFEHLVMPSVANYIKRHGLYKNE